MLRHLSAVFYFVTIFEMKNFFEMLRNQWVKIDRKWKMMIGLVLVLVIIGSLYLLKTVYSREITWKELTK